MLLQAADDLLDQGLPPANLTYFDFSDDRLTDPLTCRQVAELRVPGIREDRPRVLLLDEVGHAAGEWGKWVKGAVDREEAKICATDSSASLLRPDGRESALGRTDELRIEGLSLSEVFRLMGRFGSSDDRQTICDQVASDPELVEFYLTVGGFPRYLIEERFLDSPAVALERLRRDIAEKAVVNDLSRSGVDIRRVRALFTYLVQDSGAIFTLAERAKDLDADPRSVSDWLRLLEETCLVETLPRFAQRASARLRSSGKPRVHAADPGLVAAFATGLRFANPETRGRILEAAVFRHLREQARAHRGSLSFFRYKDRHEIDFVFESPAGRVGIEVTGRRDVRSAKLAKLREANEVLKADRLFLVYGGVMEQEIAGVQVVPVAHFLAWPGRIVEEEPNP